MNGSSIHLLLLPEIQFKSDDLPGVSASLSPYMDAAVLTQSKLSACPPPHTEIFLLEAAGTPTPGET